MTARVVYKPEVPQDILQIARYLDERSITAADRFIERLRVAIPELARMPGKGSLKQLRHPRLRAVRSWSVQGYRQYLILYRPIEDGIEILAITHGSRKLRKLLIQRLT